MFGSLVCVDASIIVDRVLGIDDVLLQAQWDSWINGETQLIAPHLIYYEVTNVIYQIGKKGQLAVATTAEALQLLIALPIKTYTALTIHDDALTLARELGIGATYDAHYLALAKQLDCDFWTRDAKLAQAAQPKYGWVRLLIN